MLFNKKLHSILLVLFFAFSAQVRADFMGSVTNSKGVVTNIETNSSPASFDFFFLTKYAYLNHVETDLLAPAGMGSNTLTVGVGYCAVVSNASLFMSDKTVYLGEGRYDVVSQFGLTGGIKSLLLYPKRNLRSCKQGDIPTVKHKDKPWSYPVLGTIFPSHSIYTNGSFPFSLSNDSAMYILTIDSTEFGLNYYNTGSIIYWNANKGGWIGQTKTLVVPVCYKVTLGNDSGSKTFGPGTWDISASSYSTNRTVVDPDCLVYSSGSNNQIRYTGGTNKLCLTTENNSTADGARIVLGSCSGQSFKLLEDGTLHHIPSGKCAHPNGGSPTPSNGTNLILHSGCGEDRLKYSFTTGNSLKQITSGMCVHPAGGSASSPAGTPLVFWAGCNESRLSFAPYSESTCTTTPSFINIGQTCNGDYSCQESFGRACYAAGGTTVVQGGYYYCQKSTTTCINNP